MFNDITFPTRALFLLLMNVLRLKLKCHKTSPGLDKTGSCLAHLLRRATASPFLIISLRRDSAGGAFQNDVNSLL